MSGFDPGRITVRFSLTDGVVTEASIGSARPLSLASRFAGRPIEQAVEAVGLVNAVCGVSHAAALTFAAAAAGNRTIGREEAERWRIRLAAERIAEHLRELVRLAPVAAFPIVRDALDAARKAARTGIVGDDIRTIGTAFGLVPDWLPALPGHPSPPDALTVDDDAAVVAALESDADFASRPFLPGRHPETGPAVRLGWSASVAGATDAARLVEAEEALGILLNGAGNDRDFTAWLAASRTQTNTGYASVESPRGRLYYFAVVQGDGRLRDARVVAPTEWNFHPDGPFARALAGFRPDGDTVTAIARLAAQFSPCVAVDVVPKGPADA
ncbi:hypothetical protein [Pleomorphomonas carboxyditropha]|uniref:Hydrogenase expression/formation protein HupK n=1 Tax=Pleomorphomonas carboxyditropha TaxID=2023338 RepID=A0A2G9WQG4_9HYPH|nr:hypothetical protein [Pleomorphomonas carboxyditropha]PIO96895.1 hypothetical protein CJ014_23175 [Pleomorphomonas carboxyditropha]